MIGALLQLIIVLIVAGALYWALTQLWPLGAPATETRIGKAVLHLDHHSAGFRRDLLRRDPTDRCHSERLQRHASIGASMTIPPTLFLMSAFFAAAALYGCGHPAHARWVGDPKVLTDFRQLPGSTAGSSTCRAKVATFVARTPTATSRRLCGTTPTTRSFPIRSRLRVNGWRCPRKQSSWRRTASRRLFGTRLREEPQERRRRSTSAASCQD